MVYMNNGRSIAKKPVDAAKEVEPKGKPEKLPESKKVDLKESMARRLAK